MVLETNKEIYDENSNGGIHYFFKIFLNIKSYLL